MTCRYPWKYSIIQHGFVLFLGREFIQRCESTHNAQQSFCSSSFHRPSDIENPRRMTWALTGFNQVVHRTCCEPDWSGWFCHICKHQHWICSIISVYAHCIAIVFFVLFHTSSFFIESKTSTAPGLQWVSYAATVAISIVFSFPVAFSYCQLE